MKIIQNLLNYNKKESKDDDEYEYDEHDDNDDNNEGNIDNHSDSNKIIAFSDCVFLYVANLKLVES